MSSRKNKFNIRGNLKAAIRSSQPDLNRIVELADQLPGGRADDRPDSDFDSGQLQNGIEVEYEHTKDKSLAKEIAKDHLVESPDYYRALDKMERSLGISSEELNDLVDPVD